MTLKRFICSCGIILILSMSFITGYTKSVSFVYADAVTDGWTQVTTNDQLVEAFRYYCKSRDITFNGGIADAVTHFTTKTFNGLCNTLGINLTALQAHLKYQTDGNLGLRYLFDTEGISLYNRIFAQFLQDNDLAVGDTVDDKDLFSGKWYVDAEGFGALVWDMPVNDNNTAGIKPNVYGSTYKYTGSDIKRLYDAGQTIQFIGSRNNGADFTVTPVIHHFDSVRVADFNDTYTDVYTRENSNTSFTFNRVYYAVMQNKVYECQCIAFTVNGGNSIYIGSYMDYRSYTPNSKETWQYFEQYTQPKNVTPTNIYITTNNTTINNNTYEGDTIINNNGTPEDGDNPSGGGGNTTTPPTNTGGGEGEDDGTITFPDFDFNLPEINWSLGDLSEKFPFSIPFDLIAFFTVLNAEPQAPAIDADIPLGSWYTWHFEADFSQFDNYAVIIRNVEFIGFCVGLIYLTIKLVKG